MSKQHTFYQQLFFFLFSQYSTEEVVYNNEIYHEENLLFNVQLVIFLKFITICILESSWVDSSPLEVLPAALALRLARYAAQSVLPASEYQVKIHAYKRKS